MSGTIARASSRLLALGAVGALGILVGSVAAGSGGVEQPEGDMGQMPPEMQKEMEAWMKAGQINEHHEWLARAEGAWKGKSWFQWDPNMPKMHAAVESEVESILGGRYTVMHYESEFMGQPYKGVGIVGYDNIKQKYVSIWLESMGTSPMVSYGTRTGDTITFKSEFENPMGEMETMYIESTSHGENRMVDKFYEHRDGKKVQTGQIVYERASDGN